MARRVGFGDSEEKQAESAAARKEKRARRDHAQRAALDERPARRRGDDEPPRREGRGGVGRLIAGVFLLIWLCGWSAGIVFAFGAMMDEGLSGGGLFLIVWLSVAIAGWVFAARMLLRLVRGEPLRRRRDRSGAAAPAMRAPRTSANINSGGEDRF